MILAANDVADVQIRIVGAGSHVVRRRAVTAQQREVLDVFRGFRLRAVNQIVERHFLTRFARHLEAQHERLARHWHAGRFPPSDMLRISGSNLPDGAPASVTSSSETRPVNEIAIREALGENRLRRLLMQLAALGLPVEFVPAQIQPLQPLVDRIERFLGIPLDVGVVDAQDHSAAVAAGIQPVKNERPGAANVEIPRGRRGKADSKHQSFQDNSRGNVMAVSRIRFGRYNWAGTSEEIG